MTFDALLAKAELDSFEVLLVHHLRQIRLAHDRPTCLLFATKLGMLASSFQNAAAVMRREVLCQCGLIVENRALGTCPSCGRQL
jgi:hypothetical protein